MTNRRFLAKPAGPLLEGGGLETGCLPSGGSDTTALRMRRVDFFSLAGKLGEGVLVAGGGRGGLLVVGEPSRGGHGAAGGLGMASPP